MIIKEYRIDPVADTVVATMLNDSGQPVRVFCDTGGDGGNAFRSALDSYSGAASQALYFDGSVIVDAGNAPSLHHIFNYTTKQWEDPRTLVDIQAQQWEQIKQARSAAEYAGFTWDGSVFDSDATSQNRITGAVTLAQMSSAFTIDWTLQDNTVRTLNAQEMCAVGAALGTHVQTQFAKGQALRAQIEAATTKEAVEAVVW